MKTLLQITLILATAEAFGQDGEVLSKGDSLLIRDANIAINPFNFGKDPLTYLTTKVCPLTGKKTKLHKNRHVRNKVDTAFHLKFAGDKFVIYKWGREENAILRALLTTSKFSTKHGIKVGMTETDVINLLKKKYEVTSIPEHLILENSVTNQYLKIDLNGDTVSRIEFHGYID